MDIDAIRKEFQIPIKNKLLIYMALTHSSFSSNKEDLLDNQRLELLGDSVLGFIVIEYLYHKFPSYREGKITKIKNYLISKPVLSRLARKINMGYFLVMSPAEEASGGKNKDSSLADALEAVIGAVYLDSGLEVVRKFILTQMESEIKKILEADRFISDYKSELQYLVQKRLKLCPDYITLKEEGPNHDKIFTVGFYINDVFYAQAEAKNKKQAEQNVAKIVYNKIIEGEIIL